jgi:hypothetical protein
MRVVLDGWKTIMRLGKGLGPKRESANLPIWRSNRVFSFFRKFPEETKDDKRFERGSILNEGLILCAGMERDLYLL